MHIRSEEVVLDYWEILCETIECNWKTRETNGRILHPDQFACT